MDKSSKTVRNRQQIERRKTRRRNDDIINELVTRKNRYTRSNREKESNNGNNIVEELVTRNGRYTRKNKSKDSLNRNPINNQSPINQSPINQSPINQSPINQSPINQSPINQSPINQSPNDIQSPSPEPDKCEYYRRDDFSNRNGEIISSEVLNCKLNEIDNSFNMVNSYYCSLSQLLTGNSYMMSEIKTQVQTYTSELNAKSITDITNTAERDLRISLESYNDYDPQVLLTVASLMFKFKIIVFRYVRVNMYQIVTIGDDQNFKRVMYIKDKNNKISAMRLHRSNDEEEFEIEEILSHKNLVMLSNGAQFCTKWRRYSDESNTMEPWDGLVDTQALERYIRNLGSRVRGANKAKLELGIVEIDKPKKKDREKYGVDVFDPNYKRNRFGSRNNWYLRGNKKFTGKKMKVAVDILNLKGKGGCYCFMPYESVDDNNKALFKIGMTVDFSSRLDNYHTSFPGGVYHVAFLIEPPIDIWDNDRIVEWKTNTEKRNKTKKDVIRAMKEEKYKEIEKFLFKFVTDDDGRRLHSTVNVKGPDETKKGSTEWFYTDIDLIHLAFITAEQEYGGENLLYYFSGLDPDTGEQFGSINEIAQEKKKNFPYFTGNITYSV
jgi:hypothetical protein